MEGLRFRGATAADTKRIGEIIFGDPPREMVGIMGGDVRRASAFGKEMVRLPRSSLGWQRTVIAELDGEAAGVLQAGGESISAGITPAYALLALRIFGLPGALKLLAPMRARSRLGMQHPAGSYQVHELHVDTNRRNRGIGGYLLRYAEEDAWFRGHRVMSLTTTTSNPARRLYERHGFEVAQTRTDPDYERYTGIAGRHLMVKELT